MPNPSVNRTLRIKPRKSGYLQRYTDSFHAKRDH